MTRSVSTKPPVTTTRRESADPRWTGPGFSEFVGIVALMMAVTAMSIDNLLPAFPAIQARFGIDAPTACNSSSTSTWPASG